MKILSNAQRYCKRGPAAWFTGEVWMNEIVEPTAPAKAQAVLVTYAPGARTAWHMHPLGQTLYIISGLGWIQKQGEPKSVLRPGDVAVIAPGENHWHRAGQTHTMVHFAMQEADETGKNVYWAAAVTDAEYE